MTTLDSADQIGKRSCRVVGKSPVDSSLKQSHFFGLSLTLQPLTVIMTRGSVHMHIVIVKVSIIECQQIVSMLEGPSGLHSLFEDNPVNSVTC